MSVINLSKNEFAKAIILFAISGEVEKIDQMESIPLDHGDLLKDVKLIVGGVELNFENVVKRIGDQLDHSAQEAAQRILLTKVNTMMDELNDIHTYIENHKELFKEDWSED